MSTGKLHPLEVVGRVVVGLLPFLLAGAIAVLAKRKGPKIMKGTLDRSGRPIIIIDGEADTKVILNDREMGVKVFTPEKPIVGFSDLLGAYDNAPEKVRDASIREAQTIRDWVETSLRASPEAIQSLEQEIRLRKLEKMVAGTTTH